MDRTPKDPVEKKRPGVPPTHPGVIVREEFLKARSLSAYRVARDIGVPAPRLNDILLQKRSMSPEMCILLAHYFGTSQEFFMNLQCDYDRRIAAFRLRDSLAKITPYSSER